jgi:hypothetical protein
MVSIQIVNVGILLTQIVLILIELTEITRLYATDFRRDRQETKLDSLTKVNLQIKKDDLATLLGGRRGQGFSHSLNLKLQNARRALHKLTYPRLLYHKKRIAKVEKGCVFLKDGPVFKSSKLARVLRDCDEIICFLITMGGRIESEISRMMRQNRLSEAYVLDALGSVSVETLTEQFHRDMEKKYKKERKAVTLRFSPGYCDWSVADQKKLFSFLDSDRIGVELQHSCLMRPRKSISGVFGLYPTFFKDHPALPYNPCLDCSKIGCSSRRAIG